MIARGEFREPDLRLDSHELPIPDQRRVMVAQR
jgi:hypothetical protein